MITKQFYFINLSRILINLKKGKADLKKML